MPSILLLDDEPHVLTALRRCLRAGLADLAVIETYTDPYLALERAGAQAFDVVISDFRMPAMDGIQFLRFFRAIQPNAVRMMVSASTEFDGVMSAINDVGAFRYVVKPWTPELLIEDVRDALAHARSDHQQRAQAAVTSMGETASRQAAEALRLEALEPGLTEVVWGPGGEVVMPQLYPGTL